MERPGPPSNYRAGQLASAEFRSARSSEHKRRTWAIILGLAAGLRSDNVRYNPSTGKVSAKERAPQPRTLEEFAAALNLCGSRTAKGLPWTASLVQRVFKAHQMTPKKLSASLLPQPFLPRPTWPRQSKQKHLSQMAPHDVEPNHFGVWTPGVVRLPRKGDLVRLRQTQREYAAGTVFLVAGRTKKQVSVTHLYLPEATFDLTDLDCWVEKAPPSPAPHR